jgi:hypothetical protein
LKTTDKCKGYTQQTVTTVASLTLPSDKSGTAPNFVMIVAEAQAVRWRDDGVDPTTTVGMPLAVGATLLYDGDLNKIRFIAQVAGGIINSSFYN